jgi:hypothetical protein
MINERIYLSKFINNEDKSNDHKKLFKSIIKRIKNISYEDLVYDKETSIKNSGDNENFSFFLPDELHKDVTAYIKLDDCDKEIYGYPYGVDCERKNFNRTHMDEISEYFQGIGFGYKLYKATAMRLGHISSESNASSSAQYVWQYLAKDKDFYTILTRDSILIISKKLEKTEIEDLVFKFIQDRTKIKKQIFTKENYRKMKLNCILYLDEGICELLKEYKIERLNINYIEKYASIYTRTKYKKINSEFPTPFLGQNAINHKTKETFYVGGYEKTEKGIRYILRNGYNTEHMTREDFFIMDSKVPNKTKSIKEEELLEPKMYLNLSSLTPDDIGDYDSPYFILSQINYDDKVISYVDNNGYNRDIEKFKVISPIEVTYDNILPNRYYYVIYDNCPQLVKLNRKLGDDTVELTINSFRGWRSEKTRNVDLKNRKDIVFYDYSVEEQTAFLHNNSVDIENTKHDMLKLMKSQYRKEKRDKKKKGNV